MRNNRRLDRNRMRTVILHRRQIDVTVLPVELQREATRFRLPARIRNIDDLLCAAWLLPKRLGWIAFLVTARRLFQYMRLSRLQPHPYRLALPALDRELPGKCLKPALDHLQRVLLLVGFDFDRFRAARRLNRDLLLTIDTDHRPRRLRLIDLDHNRPRRRANPQ